MAWKRSTVRTRPGPPNSTPLSPFSFNEPHKIPILNAIRTDQIIGKAARAHKLIADLDPKAKALEDYAAATLSLLEIFKVEGLSTEPQHDESIAV